LNVDRVRDAVGFVTKAIWCLDQLGEPMPGEVVEAYGLLEAARERLVALLRPEA